MFYFNFFFIIFLQFDLFVAIIQMANILLCVNDEFCAKSKIQVNCFRMEEKSELCAITFTIYN